MIYLNNAATSFPKPLPVVEAVCAVLQEPPVHHARVGFHGNAPDVPEECRGLLARLFNVADPCQIVFTSGGTASLNLAIRGLNLQGKHVVTTAVEHNSVLRPLKTLEKSGGLKLTIVACDADGYVPPENVAHAIQANTAAVIVNHCSNVTGMVNDLQAIGKLTKQQGAVFIVDAAQSAGVIPIDVPAMHIDVLTFTGHKTLYGMQGSGGVYIGKDVALEPLLVGGTGIRSDYLFQPEEMPLRFEAGTPNIPGIAALRSGVEFILQQGIDVIRAHKQRLVRRMREHLQEIPGARLYPDRECQQPTTLFSFNLADMYPDDVGYMLHHAFQIVTRAGLHCAPLIHQHIGTFPAGSVRVSPSCFTTDEETRLFCTAVEQISAQAVAS